MAGMADDGDQLINDHHLPPVQPDETAVTTLVSMGFPEGAARQALITTGNNVDLATNILLDSARL